MNPGCHGNPQPSFFRSYNPYVGGVKPSFFMVLGSKGGYLIVILFCSWHK